jgi:hypothetical protein
LAFIWLAYPSWLFPNGSDFWSIQAANDQLTGLAVAFGDVRQRNSFWTWLPCHSGFHAFRWIAALMQKIAEAWGHGVLGCICLCKS